MHAPAAARRFVNHYAEKVREVWQVYTTDQRKGLERFGEMHDIVGTLMKYEARATSCVHRMHFTLLPFARSLTSNVYGAPQ